MEAYQFGSSLFEAPPVGGDSLFMSELGGLDLGHAGSAAAAAATAPATASAAATAAGGVSPSAVATLSPSSNGDVFSSGSGSGVDSPPFWNDLTPPHDADEDASVMPSGLKSEYHTAAATATATAASNLLPLPLPALPLLPLPALPLPATAAAAATAYPSPYHQPMMYQPPPSLPAPAAVPSQSQSQPFKGKRQLPKGKSQSPPPAPPASHLQYYPIPAAAAAVASAAAVMSASPFSATAPTTTSAAAAAAAAAVSTPFVPLRLPPVPIASAGAAVMAKAPVAAATAAAAAAAAPSASKSESKKNKRKNAALEVPTAAVAASAAASPVASQRSVSPKSDEPECRTSSNSSSSSRSVAPGGVSSGGSDDEESGSATAAASGDPAESKRQKRLMRNRASAQLSRERKKIQMQKLEAQLAVLATQNQELTSQIQALTHENQFLRLQYGVTGMNDASGAGGATAVRQYDGAKKAKAAALLAKVRAYNTKATPSARFIAMPTDDVTTAAAGGGAAGGAARGRYTLKRGLMLFAFVLGVSLFGTLWMTELAPVESFGPFAGSTSPASPRSGVSITVVKDEKAPNSAAAAAAAVAATSAPNVSASPKPAAAAAAVRRNTRVLLQSGHPSALDSALSKLTDEYDEELPPSTTAVAMADGPAVHTPLPALSPVSTASPARITPTPLALAGAGASASAGIESKTAESQPIGGSYRNMNATAAEPDRGVWNTGKSGATKIRIDDSTDSDSDTPLVRGINQLVKNEPNLQQKADGLDAYRALLSSNVSFDRAASYILCNEIVHIPAAAHAHANDSIPSSPASLPPLSPLSHGAADSSSDSDSRPPAGAPNKRVRVSVDGSFVPGATPTPLAGSGFGPSAVEGDKLMLLIPTAALMRQQNASGSGIATANPFGSRRESGVTQVTCSIQKVQQIQLSAH